MKRSWYLVRTKPSQESYAAENCKKQGCRTFLPLYHCNERDRLIPLFASYLFVQTTGQWHFLESTYGVLKVIRWGDTPETIPNKIIAALRKRADRKGVVKVKQRKQFEEGDEVRIKEGPFRDLLAIVTEQDNQKRVYALLNILGRAVSVTLKVRDVERVAA